MTIVVHGTTTAYKYHGCRCDDCTRAEREYKRRSRSGRGYALRGPLVRSVHAKIPKNLVEGRLAVTCWCEEAIVLVPQALISRGETLECGLPDCRPPQ